MSDWLFTAGVIVSLLAMLFMVGGVIYILLTIFLGIREFKAMEKRRVSVMVPGLGKFSATDDRLWSGVVQGLSVSIDTAGGPPSPEQAARVLGVVGELPAWVAKSIACLKADEQISWLRGRAGEFEPARIDLGHDGTLSLEFSHPADQDGIHRVSFAGTKPISSARDD